MVTKMTGAVLVPVALAAAPVTNSSAEVDMGIRQALSFMRDYGHHLEMGDRLAIAHSYSRSGARLGRNGESHFYTASELEARYGSQNWNPPLNFKWLSLHAERLNAGTMRVTGSFSFDTRENETRFSSYTAELAFEHGQLRIRSEDEVIQSAEDSQGVVPRGGIEPPTP